MQPWYRHFLSTASTACHLHQHSAVVQDDQPHLPNSAGLVLPRLYRKRSQKELLPITTRNSLVGYPFLPPTTPFRIKKTVMTVVVLWMTHRFMMSRLTILLSSQTLSLPKQKKNQVQLMYRKYFDITLLVQKKKISLLLPESILHQDQGPDAQKFLRSP